MSTINPLAIPNEYVELTKCYSDFDPSKYSEKLKETLAIECFEERILALYHLYLNYEEKLLSISCICFKYICEGISSDEIEEKKKEMKFISSEKSVIRKNIGEMLDKYNEVQFPSHINDHVSKVEFLNKKKLISKHS